MQEKEGIAVQILDDGNCFICGKDNPIGFKAVFDIDPVQL